MIDIPEPLLRFFTEEEHARQFVSGAIRFGLLDHYRKAEGERRDITEGESSVRFPVRGLTISSKVTSLNKYYVLATSSPDADRQRLATAFGRFCVEIEDPTLLLSRIKSAWRIHELAISDGAFVCPVEYTKDELTDPPPGFRSRVHLTYCQKPRTFEHEKEYRFVLQCRVDSTRRWDDYLLLQLPDCRDICSNPMFTPDGYSL